MPRAPDMGEASGFGMGDAFSVAGAATTGLGDALPGFVGAGVGLVGTTLVASQQIAAGDVSGAASTVADDLIGRGLDMVEGGWLVGGFIMLARGTEQALSRSDAMVSYLNMMGGFVHTLVRASIDAVNEPAPYTRMPMPVVPSYVERTGDLHSSFARDAFTDGYNRIRDCVRDIDSVRPPTGDHPSKRCLMHIGLQANMCGGSRMGAAERLQMRERAERYVVAELLRVDLRRQAEALRRWANAH